MRALFFSVLPNHVAVSLIVVQKYNKSIKQSFN